MHLLMKWNEFENQKYIIIFLILMIDALYNYKEE